MSKKEKLNAFIEEKIISENLETVLGERFGRYSKYIIQDRALPDVRDGLKPVQRRILYAMYKMGMQSDKPYKKCARIAGEVMGKYHPHGDSSIYDAMVRLSQPWKQGATLIDMHGNNGSIDGDSAAAMRYTEARLTKDAEALLEDIDKRTVLFVPNFDDEELEPTVLPAKFPNLLVNGGSGISAGYATKIPPHNLKEVINAAILKIEKPDMHIDDLMKVMKGPDFPTGATVYGQEGIKQAFLTGAGRIILRSKTSVEEVAKNTYKIVITEIPFEVNKADLVKAIDMLRVNKRLEDISEVRDESDKDGLRITIDFKKGANMEVCLNYLLKHTEMQVNYNYNMVAINKQRPVLMGVLEILDAYINHQKEVITNRSNYNLNKAEKRLHIVSGLIKMVDVLDLVIQTIRNSKNKQNSKDNLVNKFGFTDLQAEAIVMLQLYRLSTTDINSLISEKQALEKQVLELEEILSSEQKLLSVIKKELKGISKNLSVNRKTVIKEEIEQIKIDKIDLISEEVVHVGITKDGYIKRSNIRSYKASRRAGLKEFDGMMFEADVSTHDTLLMFTTLGNYLYMPIYELEESKWGDLGIYINNIIPMEKDEMIMKVVVVNDFNENTNILLATKQGKIKQTALKDFNVSRYSRTIKAMNLAKGDKLISVEMTTLSNIICFTKRGQALRFKQLEIPVYGTQSSGIKSMNIKAKDSLAKAIYAKETDELLILSNRGHIKKESVSNLPLSKRLRASVLIWASRARNPHFIVDVARVSPEHIEENAAILLTAKKNSIALSMKDLKPSVAEYGKQYLPLTSNGFSLFINVERVLEKEDLVMALDIKNALLEAQKKKEERALKKQTALNALAEETLKDKPQEEKLAEPVFDKKDLEEKKGKEEKKEQSLKDKPETKKENKEKHKITKLSLFDEWED